MGTYVLKLHITKNGKQFGVDTVIYLSELKELDSLLRKKGYEPDVDITSYIIPPQRTVVTYAGESNPILILEITFIGVHRSMEEYKQYLLSDKILE